MGVRPMGDPVRGHAAPVRRYDFRVPDKFPKDTLRQVHHLHEGMARTLTTSLSAQLRSTVRVEDAVAEQRTYQEFVAEASDPAILAVFTAQPLHGNALLELDPVVAFPILDRLLGGTGEAAGPPRPVTEIELTVIQRVLHTALDHWRDAWAHVQPMQLRVLGVETNPLFAQLLGPNEIVLAVSLTCAVGRREGRLRFCFPQTMIEPLLSRLVARQWIATNGQVPGTKAAELRRELAWAPVPVAVEVGRVRLPLGRVLGLAQGDLLPIGTVSQPARVLVRGRPKFRGRVGTNGGRLAVQVLGPWAGGR